MPGLLCDRCGSDQFFTGNTRKCAKCGLEAPVATLDEVARGLERVREELDDLKLQVRRLNGIWGKSDKNPNQDALF